MANRIKGPLLLEDAYDIASFLEYTERTVPRSKWAIESINAAQQASLESMF